MLWWTMVYIKRMQTLVRAIFVVCATLLITAGGSTIAAVPPDRPVVQEGNLIRNPGFEGNFFSWQGIGEVQVAHEWTPWWVEDPDHNPAYFRPEYKRATTAAFPGRVLSGSSAQQWFTFHASHVAGMYQQVFNVTPGQRYRFTIWAQVWSSSKDDPNISVTPANPRLHIGIDPTGQWSAGSPNVVWSAEAPMSAIIDRYAPVSVEATAQSDVITVFMRTSPDFANKHNDMYWDDASLVAVAPPGPTQPPPTDTPGPPTSTPEASATSPPSETPIPTNTIPPPTATPTLLATDTPLPSDTPTVTLAPPASDTPSPSETPIPTTTPTVEQPTPTLTLEQPTATPIIELPTATLLSPTNTMAPTATLESTEIAAIPSPLATTENSTAESAGETSSLQGLLVAAGLLLLFAAGIFLFLFRKDSG
jgi:hypothetical protein